MLKEPSDNYKEMSENYNSMKKEIETINKIRKNEQFNFCNKNTLEEVTSRLDEADNLIREL